MPQTIMLAAGEASGDMHAATLVRELLKRNPGLRFFGIGGPALRAQGMEILQDIGEMSVMGLTEVMARLFFFRRVFRRMVTAAVERRPCAVILVDYPGFNLRLASVLHDAGLTIIYYICPQVWAWNRSRIPRMARIVDRLISIFPFEPAIFEGTGLRVDFVGHPLLDAAAAAMAEPPAALPWRSARRVAILPGSRSHEVRRLLPMLWQAAGLLDRQFTDTCFLFAAASPDMANFLRALLSEMRGGPPRWDVVQGQTRQVLRQAHAAIVASGTATVEAAMMRCPMVIVYKVSWPTYALGRLVVKVPHIGMVNLVAGREICPEFLQAAATPSRVANALAPLLDDTPRRKAMLTDLEEMVSRLGQPGAAGRAADIVMECIR